MGRSHGPVGTAARPMKALCARSPGDYGLTTQAVPERRMEPNLTDVDRRRLR